MLGACEKERMGKGKWEREEGEVEEGRREKREERVWSIRGRHWVTAF